MKRDATVKHVEVTFFPSQYQVNLTIDRTDLAASLAIAQSAQILQ
jgi:hypothetical protein